MSSSSNRFVQCDFGGQTHRHWGALGAAGLFLVDDDERVLLQLRSEKSHGGRAWAVPGGAIDPGETPLQAAVRETLEEVGVDASGSGVRVLGEHVHRHGAWTFTTIVARTSSPETPHVMNAESEAVAWVPVTDLPNYHLLPAFASSLPKLLGFVD